MKVQLQKNKELNPGDSVDVGEGSLIACQLLPAFQLWFASLASFSHSDK